MTFLATFASGNSSSTKFSPPSLTAISDMEGFDSPKGSTSSSSSSTPSAEFSHKGTSPYLPTERRVLFPDSDCHSTRYSTSHHQTMPRRLSPCSEESSTNHFSAPLLLHATAILDRLEAEMRFGSLNISRTCSLPQNWQAWSGGGGGGDNYNHEGPRSSYGRDIDANAGFRSVRSVSLPGHGDEEHAASGLAERFALGRELGCGHFGAVRECVDRTSGAMFACKTILKQKLQRPQDLEELGAEMLTPLLLQQMEETDTRDSFVRLHALFEDSDAVHLVMDHCAGGDLFDFIDRQQQRCRSSRRQQQQQQEPLEKRGGRGRGAAAAAVAAAAAPRRQQGGLMSERRAARIVCQLAEAVCRMHAAGVVHRDIKPENILMVMEEATNGDEAEGEGEDDGCHAIGAGRNDAGGDGDNDVDDGDVDASMSRWSVKVADFGLAKRLTAPRERLVGLVGSPFYLAPEVAKGRAYGAEVDVWSMGVVMYACISGMLPFCGQTNHAVFKAVCRADPDLSISEPWPDVSSEAKDLLRRMLDPNPTTRIRSCDVGKHPWFQLQCPERQLQLLPTHTPCSVQRFAAQVCAQRFAAQVCVQTAGTAPVHAAAPDQSDRSDPFVAGCPQQSGRLDGDVIASSSNSSISSSSSSSRSTPNSRLPRSPLPLSVRPPKKSPLSLLGHSSDVYQKAQASQCSSATVLEEDSIIATPCYAHGDGNVSGGFLPFTKDSSSGAAARLVVSVQANIRNIHKEIGYPPLFYPRQYGRYTVQTSC